MNVSRVTAAAFSLALAACDPISSRVGASPADSAIADETGIEGGESGLRSATFTGTIVTVAESPLGLGDESRGAAAVATLTWDVSVADSEAGDPERGTYEHRGTSGLTVELAGHTITGSGSATFATYRASSVSFGMDDGAQLPGDNPPQMLVNGVPDDSMGLFFAIVDTDGTALNSDALPDSLAAFDPVQDPHTFSLEGAGGTLLLQFEVIE